MDEIERVEWLAKRRNCITGTDISAIVGLNKYSSPMQVFMEKLGLIEGAADNEAMYWGRELEPVIANRYARDHGVDLIEPGFIVIDEIFGGTPDRVIVEQKVLEIKTSGQFTANMWGEPGTDQIPEHYMCQVQWYMMLTGLPCADLAVLINGQRYQEYSIDRNDRLIDVLKQRGRDFWETHIIPQSPPLIDGTSGSDKFLDAFFPMSRGNILKADENLDLLARQLAEVRKELTRLESNKTALENEIKFAIGDNDGIESEFFKATWKSTKSSEKIDYKALSNALNPPPDMIEKFTQSVSGYRRFNFKTIEANY